MQPEIKVSKIEGGTMMIRGQEVPCREQWVFDAGTKGTARIFIAVEPPCTEEQRKKNRQRVDDAVRFMWRSQAGRA